jgi:hypothetical protein
MDRERKLLYTVAVLAPIIEGLMFASWYQPDISARTTEALADAYSCQQHLFKAWAECSPRHFRRKNI